MEIDLFVGQFVLLGQTATTNLKSLSISQRLVLSGSLHQNMMPVEGSSFLALHDIVHLVKTQNLSAANALTLSMSTHPRVDIKSVGQFLSLSQAAKLEAGGAKSALALSQTVVVSASRHTSNTLALSHSVTISGITRSFAIQDFLGLSHGISVYSPKRSFSTFNVVIPALQDVRFLNSVVDETFRPPIFGNQDELSFQRINRRSRGGDLIIFRDAEWPMTETLHLNFDFPNQRDADRLITVLRNTIGQYVQYTDHEAQAWIGIIKNPDSPRIQVGKNTFNVEVVMEVERVPTLSAQITDTLELTDKASCSSEGSTHLTLAQSVICHVTRSPQVAQSLTLTHEAFRGYYASDTLVLTQFASALNPLESLSLTQSAHASVTYHRSLSSRLELFSDIPAFALNNAYHTTRHLFLHQTASALKIPNRPLSQSLALTQEVTVDTGQIINRSVAHTLELSDFPTRMGRTNGFDFGPDTGGSTYYNENQVWNFRNEVTIGDLIVVSTQMDYNLDVMGEVVQLVDYGPPAVTDAQGNFYTYLGVEFIRWGTPHGGVPEDVTFMYLFYTFATATGVNPVTVAYAVTSYSPAVNATVGIQCYYGLTDFTAYAHQNDFITVENTLSKELAIDHPDSLAVAVMCLVDNDFIHTLSYETEYTDSPATGRMLPPFIIAGYVGGANVTQLIDAVGVLGARPAPLDALANVNVSCTLHGEAALLVQVMFQAVSFKSNNR